MKQRLAASVLFLIFSSANAFSTVSSRTDSFHAKSFRQLQKQNVRQNELKSSSPTALKMSVAPAGAIAGAITGGLFAGGLHAIAGELKKFRCTVHIIHASATDRLPR